MNRLQLRVALEGDLAKRFENAFRDVVKSEAGWTPEEFAAALVRCALDDPDERPEGTTLQ